MWATALALAIATSSASFESEGVRIDVDVRSHIYTWTVTNVDAPPITTFEVRNHNTYNHKAPDGWDLTYDYRHFRVEATTASAAIRRGRSRAFAARVGSNGAVLGLVTASVGVGDGMKTIPFEVWGPRDQPRIMVVIVIVVLVMLASLHAWGVARRERKAL